MAIPNYQVLMLPVLKAAAMAEVRVSEIAEKIADDFDLSETERSAILESGRQSVLQNRIHWAKFYMSKAGLIESSRRGWFTATVTGKSLLADNPEKIDVKFLMTYPGFLEFYNRDTKRDTDSIESTSLSAIAQDDSTPEDKVDAIFSALSASLNEELVQRIWQNSPVFFETLIIDLLLAMGYGGSRRNAAEHLGRSGDGGIDGVIREDMLGLDRIYVQAKRYNPSTSIGRPEIQGFVGSLVGRGATKGVFVTTASFSRQAVEYVEHLQQRVVLLDGVRVRLIIHSCAVLRTSRLPMAA